MNFVKAREHLKERFEQLSAVPDLPLHYANSYSVLLNLSDSLKEDARTEDLLKLGCAVYAWMPTILKNWDFSQFDSGELSIGMIRDCKNLDDAASLVSGNMPNPILNNSWVGTSKFLHFVNPAVFPIWDSKVAGHFDVNKYHHINSKSSYLSYLRFCWGECDFIAKRFNLFSEKFSSGKGSRITAMRVIELLLFLES